MAKKKTKVSKKAKAKKGKAKPKKKAKAKAVKRPARKVLRPAAKQQKAIKAAKPAPKRTKLGEVIHYYTHIGVAVVKVETSLKVGDTVSIEGATTNVKQNIDSMQINHNQVMEAKKGQEVGVKVADRVREGDAVYKA